MNTFGQKTVTILDVQYVWSIMAVLRREYKKRMKLWRSLLKKTNLLEGNPTYDVVLTRRTMPFSIVKTYAIILIQASISCLKLRSTSTRLLKNYERNGEDYDHGYRHNQRRNGDRFY